MEDSQAEDVGAAATSHRQKVRIYSKMLWQNPTKDSPLLVRSGVDVDVELQS